MDGGGGHGGDGGHHSDGDGGFPTGGDYPSGGGFHAHATGDGLGWALAAVAAIVLFGVLLYFLS